MATATTTATELPAIKTVVSWSEDSPVTGTPVTGVVVTGIAVVGIVVAKTEPWVLNLKNGW